MLCVELRSFFRIDSYDNLQHFDSLVHTLYADMLVWAVEGKAARSEIGAGKSHIGKARAVGSSADRFDRGGDSDLDCRRLCVTKKIGADQTFIDIAEAAAYLNTLGGADIVLECSGNYQVLENGLPYLREGGLLAVYAVPKQPYSFQLLKCPRKFSYQRIDPAVSEAIDEVCALLKEKKVPLDVFLTHTRRFEEAAELYAEVCAGNVIKGLVLIS